MLLMAAGLAMTPKASAENKITIATPVLSSNYSTIQFHLPYTGDDNSSASVFVRYWANSDSTAADTAVVPVRIHSDQRFSGVIFWLTEGVDYTLDFRITDADQVANNSATTFHARQGIQTRSSARPAVTGNQIWVSPSGNNSNDGASEGSPKQTIAAALSALSGAGAQIRLLPGVYREAFAPTVNGSASNYYSIVGHGNPDSIIICGSESSLLTGTWTAYAPGGTHLNNIYYRLFSGASSSVKLIVAGWGQRLHQKDTLPELTNTASYPDFPAQGYFLKGDTILVRLEGGADPTSTTMHIGVRIPIYIQGQFWRAESLTTRYSKDSGLQMGNYYGAKPADGAQIRNVRTYTNATYGIFSNTLTDSILIDRCTIWDGRIDSWGYYASKARNEENALGIFTRGGHNVVVRHTTVRGTSNGISVSGEFGDKSMGASSDVHDNVIEHVADDAFEFDYNQGVNVGVWGNRTRGTNHAWSQTTMDTGPTYVMYNIFDSPDVAAIKLGNTHPWQDSARVFFYHNTMTSASRMHSLKHVGGVYSNLTFANNIMVGNATSGSADYIVDDTGGITARMSFDNDLLWRPSTSGSDTTIFRWSNVHRSFGQLRSVLGWELNGIFDNPLYVDSADADFRPTDSSPAANAGKRIQGINTPHKTRGGNYLYACYPDIGARERVACSDPPPHDPPYDPLSRRPGGPKSVALELRSLHPNPARHGMSARFAIGAPAAVSAELFDLTGRSVRRLADGEVREAGEHEIVWDGRDAMRNRVPHGVYFLRLQAGDRSIVDRFVLLP